MCCLFGIIDYKHYLSKKQINRIISTLSVACEARGTDATGIAYNYRDKLCIYKRPFPAHRMHFHIPHEIHTVMGHTRMTTQGNEEKNYNNHPFLGCAENTAFALAHNGVLYNDVELQQKEKLPEKIIETDSYVAVQLIEKYGELSFDALRYMAERLEGTYTITVMDSDSNLYFVKGDNPMCIYHWEDMGIYIYASTEEILKSALSRIPYDFGKYTRIALECGTILKIDKYGKRSSDTFVFSYPMRYYSIDALWELPLMRKCEDNTEYLSELKSVASGFGISPEYVDHLLEEGFTTDEIEEYIYCGQF